MKTSLLTAALFFAVVTAKSQFTQNFEGPSANLSSNCWTLSGLSQTTNAAEVITGTGSMLTDPVSNGTISELVTPALNITSTSFSVSFDYKLTNKLNNTAIRTIEIGFIDVAGTFSVLHTLTLDKNTPITVQNFNQTFTLGFTGRRKLSLRLGGTVSDGNSRVVFDNLSVTPNALYGTGTCNSAPIAVNDIFSGTTGAVVTGNVMLNDNEPNNENIASAIVTNSPNGTVALAADGKFTFTPNPGFVGTSTTFTYRLTDDGFSPLNSNTATVTINFSIGATLPVLMKSFTAQLNGNNKVDLKWITSTEINASHFVIERSFNGNTFSDIATVLAFGNTTEEKAYQFADNTIGADKVVVYYRLRQVDADGKQDYSATRMVRIAKQNQNAISLVTFPNPATSEVNITIPNNWQGKKVTYEIINANGQTVRKSEVSLSSQTESMNVSALTRGFYVVKASCNGEVAQQKIVKQ